MNEIKDATYEGDLTINGNCFVKGNLTVIGTITFDTCIERAIYKDVHVTSFWQAIKLLWGSR